MTDNPYLPSKTLGFGNAIAQGAQSFMTAYRGAQQQNIVNARESEEIAMKRQYYQMQMKKLQKETEPVRMDAMKIGIAAEMFGADSKQLADMKMKAIENLSNPTQAAYAQRLISMMDGPIEMDKPEFDMVEKVIGLRSSENIKGAELNSRVGIAGRQEALAYEKLKEDMRIRNDQLQETARANDQKYTAEMANRDATSSKWQAEQNLKIKEMEIQLQKMRDEAAFRDKQLTQQAELAREGEAGKNARTKMNVSARRSSTQPKLSPEVQSVNDSIQKGIDQITAIQARAPTITEGPRSKDIAIQAIKGGLEEKFDRYFKATGKRHPFDPKNGQVQAPQGPSTSSSMSISAPRGMFGDGRMGPVAPPAAAPGAKVRVRNKATGQTGVMPADKVTDKYEIIE